MGYDVDPGSGTEKYLDSEGERLRARKIMGRNNFFGFPEIERYLGWSPCDEDYGAFAKIPWTDEVLQSVKDTHILIAVSPMSILNIRHMVGKVIFGSVDLASELFWRKKKKLVGKHGKSGWLLVRKAPVPGSVGQDWETGKSLLKETEEVPKTRIVVYTMITYWAATGEFLFSGSNHVRCSDIDNCEGDYHEDHFSTGFESQGGTARQTLFICSNFDFARPGLGLASAMKPMKILAG